MVLPVARQTLPLFPSMQYKKYKWYWHLTILPMEILQAPVLMRLHAPVQTNTMAPPTISFVMRARWERILSHVPKQQLSVTNNTEYALADRLSKTNYSFL